MLSEIAANITAAATLRADMPGRASAHVAECKGDSCRALISARNSSDSGAQRPLLATRYCLLRLFAAKTHFSHGTLKASRHHTLTRIRATFFQTILDTNFTNYHEFETPSPAMS